MSFNSSSNQLRLRNNHVLTANCFNSDGELVQASLDLDGCVGNDDGSFTVGGRFFSLSARDVRLEGLNLAATLRKRDGSYTRDAINLNSFIENDCGRLAIIPYFDSALLRPAQPANGPGGEPFEVNLCSTCNDFPSIYTPDLDVTFRDLVDQNQWKRCPTCSILADVMQQFAPEGALNMDARCSGKKPLKTGDLVELDLTYYASSPVEVRCVLFRPTDAPQSTQTEVCKNFRDLPEARPIIGDSTSQESVNLVSRWIKDCVNSHVGCRGGEERVLPTRVLDLAHTEANWVRVYESKGEKATWACLSHCWGNAKSLTLTSQNIAELTKHISLEKLPKTYTDAIKFCHRLGIRYLWLDALCIKQGDVSDWRREAAKMSSYYGDCTLCIAAAQSFDHNGGCTVSGLQLNYQGSGLDQLPYSLTFREDIPHLCNQERYQHSDYFPLLTRAWVYQERQLAPRVVHFCGHELFFECLNMTACECDRIPWQSKGETWTKADLTRSVHHTGKETATRGWHFYVTSYSSLALTYLNDRLPALSGIADVFGEAQARHGLPLGRYLAGLWESTLLSDMVWHVANEAALSQQVVSSTPNAWAETRPRSVLLCKPEEYIAPSWSWASVLNPVSFPEDPNSFDVLHCSVDSISIDLATDNPKAQVRTGSITLSGKLIPSRWGLVPHYFRAHDAGTYVARPFKPNYFSLLDIKRTRQQFLESFEDRGMPWSPDYAVNKKHSHQLGDQETLFLLPFRSREVRVPKRPCHGEGEEDELMMDSIYLVLRHMTTDYSSVEALPTYQRVGWANNIVKEPLLGHEPKQTRFMLV